MQLISVEQARNHCNADSDDDSLLSIYGNAAEAAVQQLVNRNLYPTSDAFTAALVAIPAKMDLAFAAYDAAIIAADALTDTRATAVAKEMAEQTLTLAKQDQVATIYGMVATDDLISAVLLIVGHLYANREDVVTGQGAAAIQLPMAAHHLAWPHRRLGPL